MQDVSARGSLINLRSKDAEIEIITNILSKFQMHIHWCLLLCSWNQIEKHVKFDAIQTNSHPSFEV